MALNFAIQKPGINVARMIPSQTVPSLPGLIRDLGANPPPMPQNGVQVLEETVKRGRLNLEIVQTGDNTPWVRDGLVVAMEITRTAKAQPAVIKVIISLRAMMQ